MYPINYPQNFHQCSEILGGVIGTLPTVYLGMALRAKSRSQDIRNGFLDKCEKKLSRWKSQYLSLGGSFTLINSVLDAHPHTLCHYFQSPQRLRFEKRIDALRRSFLWQGNKEKRGYNLVKWKTVKRQGGLGKKNLRKQNQSLLMKWLWPMEIL